MSPPHLSQDEFLDKLGDMLSRRKGTEHGAVYLTQKRLSHDQKIASPKDADPFTDLYSDKPMSVVIRASNGKSKRDRATKIRLSTVVEPHQVDNFYLRYAEVCKAGMTSLKPRDRSKKKSKAKKKKAAV